MQWEVRALTYLFIQALNITGSIHKKLKTFVTIFGEWDNGTEVRGKQFTYNLLDYNTCECNTKKVNSN